MRLTSNYDEMRREWDGGKILLIDDTTLFLAISPLELLFLPMTQAVLKAVDDFLGAEYATCLVSSVQITWFAPPLPKQLSLTASNLDRQGHILPVGCGSEPLGTCRTSESPMYVQLKDTRKTKLRQVWAAFWTFHLRVCPPDLPSHVYQKYLLQGARAQGHFDGLPGKWIVLNLDASPDPVCRTSTHCFSLEHCMH